MAENSYQKAYSELQSIVAKMQNEEIGLDELGKEVKRAAELIKMCKDKLRDVEKEIEVSLG
ncbi:MAG: exodeoxyribonuclease VII small subunit [Saprospiraceae bacterium]|jgi:exodeoxyribonuclease VII small subunit